jgi:hypothetical protein
MSASNVRLASGCHRVGGTVPETLLQGTDGSKTPTEILQSSPSCRIAEERTDRHDTANKGILQLLDVSIPVSHPVPDGACSYGDVTLRKKRN